MDLHVKVFLIKMPKTLFRIVVVLSNPLRGIGVWRNSMEARQSGHSPRSGPEVKNGSSAKDGTPERDARQSNRK